MTRSFPTRRSSDRRAWWAVPPFAWLYRQPDISAFLRPRPGNAHKGLFGHVLCIGGERGMAGAITLCAHGALRAGSGLVSVATRTVNVDRKSTRLNSSH